MAANWKKNEDFGTRAVFRTSQRLPPYIRMGMPEIKNNRVTRLCARIAESGSPKRKSAGSLRQRSLGMPWYDIELEEN
jgi:hypothetical protein